MCYFYFDTIINDDLLKLYLKVCSKFKNVELYISSIRSQYKKYGGLWLKCYGYNYKNILSKNELKEYFFTFYKSYYDNKYKWFSDYEKFINVQHNNKINYIQLKYDIMSTRINMIKNFSEKYQIEIDPKWKKFIYGDFYLNQIYNQINYRTSPYSEYSEITRILPEKGYGYLPYGSLEKKNTNCHDGQRKLLFSEIEFYSLVSEKYDLNNILVVYVGSGEGAHEPIIFDLFPELDFYFCDPIPFVFKHPFLHNKERVKINHDYYNNETWKDVVKFNKKKKNIIFISDIREDVEEQLIIDNMVEQQLWTIQLDSVAYMLKFRLPYLFEDKFLKLKIDYEIPSKIKVNKSIFKDKSIYDFFYLKGNIYFQIYAPGMSSETRLIHVKKNKKEDFEIQKYNIEQYDGNMYYFNIIDRTNKFLYKDSSLMKYHLLGYDDSYESVSEYYIIDKYFHEEMDYKNIIQKIYDINNKLINYSHKDIVLCPFYTLYKKDLNVIYKNNKIQKIKTEKNKIMMDIIKNLYILVIFSLKNQYYYFGKGNILSYNNYEKQRYQIKEKYKLLNKYINELINKEFTKKDAKYVLIKDLLNKSDDIFDKLLDNENNSNNINNINNKYLNMFNIIYKKFV